MTDKVLVLGSGGREHTLAWKISQSNQVGQVLVAPGNAGTKNNGKIDNADVSIGDHEKLAVWCTDNNISMVVVGPENPLAAGIADVLSAHSVPCFGPSAKGAEIEASKEFAKSFMDRHNIPTAKWKSFTDAESACEHINSAPYKALVVKASGLAAGKGVIVATTKDEACKAVKEIVQDKLFGQAGETVVIEELLEGEEVSVLAFSDGTSFVPMPPAQDHKRLLEGDKGPNTGGMGAYCPCPQVSQETLKKIHSDVLEKAVLGMKDEGRPYVGVLYAGMMLTADGPKVLEFNCRFGDPECQVLLPLLKSDLYTTMQACVQGKLSTAKTEWHDDQFAVGVVLASGGYPGSYKKGMPITGLEKVEKEMGQLVFHAGTALKDGQVVTSGGRVLANVAMATDLPAAVAKAQEGAAAIQFTDAIYRKDIAYRGCDFVKKQRTSTEGGLSYSACGVNIDAGNLLVDQIKALVKSTARAGSDAVIGGFGGVFDLPGAGYKDPLLVSGTDGVGTKLKIAQACGKHSTIGIDLVAMCVNDILANGAEALFFLDYFACGRLDVKVARDVISGVTEGCRQAGCALLGGETAEMPGMYAQGDYDLAGFAVGAVERTQTLPMLDKISANDVLIGVASSGVHSNGYSLVRKVVEKCGYLYSSPCPFSENTSLGDALLTPTKIYSKTLLPAIRSTLVKAYAHITGGGLVENIPRVLPDGYGVTLDAAAWEIPPVFGWIQTKGSVATEEMARTFNCGVGATLIVGQEHSKDVLKMVQEAGEKAWIIGNVVPTKPGVPRVQVKGLDTALSAVAPKETEDAVTQNGESLHPVKDCQKLKVGVLISGTGTNLQALIDHTLDPAIGSHAEIALVISNVPGVKGLERAEKAGIPTRVIRHKEFKSRVEFDMKVHQTLEEAGIEFVCLAGFMRILSGEFVRKWHGRLINIHPSLLPSFKGMNAHKLVLDAGVRLSGCSVHYVVEEVDAGAILVQESVPVYPDDTIEVLQERVKGAEHKAYPRALEFVARQAVRLGQCGRIEWLKPELLK
ncbi:trifunctional purine biosynthetic protein adenosine-3-like isoform X2 [Ptychodera flava]